MTIKRTIRIHRTPAELYAFWRQIDNLARLAPGDTSANEVGPKRSHWKAIGPGGKAFEWDAEITQDDPDRAIAWQSLPGGDVTNSGSVRFESIDRNETQVELSIDYSPPGGFVGNLVGNLVKQHVSDEIDAGLSRVKRQLENGS